MSGLMLTFKANPQHLSAARGHEEAPRVGDRVGEKVGDRVGETSKKASEKLRGKGRKKGSEERVGESSEETEKISEETSEESSEETEKISEETSEETGGGLTSDQRQILSLLRQDKRLTARQLAEEIGVSSRTIELNIAWLKELGLLRRIGPTKGGSWEVLK